MKDLAIVITISYFMLYGAIAIVDEAKAKPAEAQEIEQSLVDTDFCELEDVFCYGELISEIETPTTVQSYAPIRPVEKSTPEKQPVGNDKKEIFQDICRKHDIYDGICWKSLYSIMTVESGGDTNAIGDHFLARGAFQIHYKLHNISLDCAYDLVCSANWTLENLISNGFPKYFSWSLGAHNSKTPYHNEIYSEAVKKVYLTL